MNTKHIFSPPIIAQILRELWEAAIFHNPLYDHLVQIAKEKHINPHQSEINIEESLFNKLATLRNRNLITDQLQEKLSATTVGIFGLSVGSHIALTWMMQSRAKNIKIIDPDTIDISNLNRIRTGWKNITKYKTSYVSHELKSINPYANIIVSRSTKKADIKNIFIQAPALDIVIDAIDNVQDKYYLRQLACQYKIPLISAADVGDNVIIDIERYDHNPQPTPFLGRIPNIENINFSQLTEFEKKKMIINLVGFESNSEDLLDSLLQLGKQIGTWPQLGATATMAGGVVTTTIKKIVAQEQVMSGRYYLDLDKILVDDFLSPHRDKLRTQKINEIKNKLQLS